MCAKPQVVHSNSSMDHGAKMVAKGGKLCIGIDLEDGDSRLLDQRFADDFSWFPPTKFEAFFMLESFMEELACVGLCPNAGKLWF